MIDAALHDLKNTAFLFIYFEYSTKSLSMTFMLGFVVSKHFVRINQYAKGMDKLWNEEFGKFIKGTEIRSTPRLPDVSEHNDRKSKPNRIPVINSCPAATFPTRAARCPPSLHLTSTTLAHLHHALRNPQEASTPNLYCRGRHRAAPRLVCRRRRPYWHLLQRFQPRRGYDRSDPGGAPPRHLHVCQAAGLLPPAHPCRRPGDPFCAIYQSGCLGYRPGARSRTQKRALTRTFARDSNHGEGQYW